MSEDVKSFDRVKSIKTGWELMKKNFWFFAGLVLITSIVAGISSQDQQNNPSVSMSIIGWILSTFVSIGVTKITLNLIDQKQLNFDELYKNGKYFVNYFLGTFLTGLLVAAGLILLIVPGFIWGARYQFVPYLIIDKDMGVMEAFSKSAEMTKGLIVELLVFDAMLIGVVVLGVLALGIGLFWAIPTVWIAMALVYRKLV